MKTKYSYKQIWTITFPILISLIMEQMIGMTDTAFLGRVGEIELGASAIATEKETTRKSDRFSIRAFISCLPWQ